MSQPSEDPFPRRLPTEGTGGIDELFMESVLPTVAGSSSETPTVLFLGGPQGSGKSSAKNVVAEQLGLRDAFQLEGDDLYDFHPHYQDLVREHDGDVSLAMKMCAKDVAVIRGLLREHLRAEGMDAVVIGPFVGPDHIEPSIRDWNDDVRPYRVQFAYLAVHSAISQLSMVSRHHGALQPGGAGHALLPPLEFHDMGIEEVPNILENLERTGLADALHVITRDGVVFSKERDQDGVWHPGASVREAFLEARERPWDRKTMSFFFEQRTELEMARWPEWGDRLARADAAAAQAFERAQWRGTSGQGPLLQMLTDPELTEWSGQLGRALGSARRPDPAPPSLGTEDVIRRLAEQGAPDEVVARAKASAREDLHHAQSEAARGREQAPRLQGQQEATVAEIGRRASLPPARRTAEAVVRQQLRTVPAPTRSQSPAAGMRISLPQPKHPSSGQSL
ncbi:zeta toxin family protein [Streptomyces sp. NPDC096176]|uniref:zeta toxin family protein n=1 Tax=Streptomyces sp. NPDC096176 TaxID=3366079 RepID=UPI00381DCE8A